jgi:hypothetical protein
MNTIAYFSIKEGDIQQKFSVKKAFDLPDGSYELTIRKKGRRSNPQNAFFHSILPELQKGFYDAGWDNVKTPEDAKWKLKKMFLTVKVYNEKTGEEDEYVRRTRDLNKEEMNTFLEEVLRLAAEYLSLTIYSPNEQCRISYE